MTEELNKQRGPPIGNQNARKHGFYSVTLDEKQQRDYDEAIINEGLDEEIALMRVKIKAVIEKDPENMKLIIQAMDSLARLLRMKYHISKGDKQTIKEAMRNVLRDVAMPIGIGLGVGKSLLK